MASVSVVSSNVQTNRNPAVGEVTTVVDAVMFSFWVKEDVRVMHLNLHSCFHFYC